MNEVNIKKFEAKKQETKIKFYILYIEILKDLWEYKAGLKDTCNSLTDYSPIQTGFYMERWGKLT